ncbi:MULTISPECIES: tRNA uridine-5-carboxymethylaminomethyl(34) synthesis GTPase MnmE [unclassified Campylobacter]|uniref:tRNA uridine-5-carboxymethylaminomethyl(34) synthesis GTPase MnmE n=1 Tax=unclassified Campylobacter TaxID=2593542 RepID=UPI0022E9A17D|nr:MULTISPECIES: tRNA uridine-5-carboxymethylaminomethyl(34) synthesis GTPase MnmE [unclassified Campylobacter]MDA3042564.1 tRNA uridine-5-carboxymethylaminomethyl(34) synthesis GTPase MnmE [Campylobacter sp. JMF_09 ED2]MDA3044622.1 tRNA uridine-5-carboxymethylaminomethyl(34) synthesis GTPase MnmE [Campylobacter sp. JMF_07 ED4]MDA3063255.1 tRNA uridine-5-carboxymethylaminomethyl(34) synthesis GTPase MnmE [Campylobacter sp. JMF_11 EL3]MDA3071599.1 tRNA uridine-5-carboxymethylaminomethyl(34) synt
MNQTIAAIATAHGVGGISIVRISGAGALQIAREISHKNDFLPRHATLANLYGADGVKFGEAIFIYFKAPHSFTGEDVVEIQTHGGLISSSMALDSVVALGARIAEPGEFSKRAFLNGKMDLSKAEAISDLILSRSESAAKILSRNLHGELEGFVNDLRAKLVKTLAFAEVCIDYAEEDLPRDVLENSLKMLNENIENLEKITQISKSRKGLIEGFKVAIVGKPNVGKSSILNALLNYERAIVSDEAGTTRDRIEESLKIGTHLIRIIDTAGIRHGESKTENIGISYSIKAIDEADIILAVFDGSANFSDEDEKIVQILEQKSDKKIFYILNKSDLAQNFAYNFAQKPLKISAKKGVDEILKELEIYLNSQNFDGLMLSNTRQINACQNALNALKSAREKLNEAELEIFAYEMNRAIEQISSISRPFERDEILDEMFGNFCLGK